MIPTLYDTFKHWASTGSVYIISDLHFDDIDCKIMDKNWITPEDQINIINKYAHKTDTLIVLGDIGDPKYIGKLKAGHKVLIMGNHDETATKFKKIYWLEKYTDKHTWEKVDNVEYFDTFELDFFMSNHSSRYYRINSNYLFDEIYEGPLFIAEKILLSHEPIEGLTWCVNIHGHDHAKHTTDKTHINLAANVCNYTPINLAQAIKNGMLSNIPTIHRITIDNATARSVKKKVNK